MKQQKEINDTQAAKIRSLELNLDVARKDRLEAIRASNDWESKAKTFEKQFFQLSENSRSMLMSMVYSLDMVTSASTHHEKEVVIRRMRSTFFKLANKPHGLSLNDELELPF